MPLRIGLTGNIASGKSTVADLLVRKGYTHIDTDQLAREVVSPGSPVLKRLVAVFGQDIVKDGVLDREALAAKVFGEPDALRQLNAITHPAIGALMLERMGAAKGPMVVSVPLLFEAGMESLFDEVWVVTCDPAEQERRLMTRNGMPPEEAQKRMASQMPQEEKARRARRVIANSGTLKALEAAVAQVLEDLG